MFSSDLLLQLVSQLQNGGSLSTGRRAILSYIRNLSNARLILLFLQERSTTPANPDMLSLLERMGRRPCHIGVDWLNGAEPVALPGHGLFGQTLQSREALLFSAPLEDSRCLPEERYWLCQGGPLILCQVGQRRGQQGVLALSFNSNDDWRDSDLHKDEGNGNFIICRSLLSSYLLRSPRLRATAMEQSLKSLMVDSTLTAQQDKELKPILPGLTDLTGPDGQEAEIRAAIDAERARIAQGLHDGPLQELTAILHKLEYCQKIFPQRSEQAQEELNMAHTRLGRCLGEMRLELSSLLPTYIPSQGLDAALRTLLEDYTRSVPNLRITYRFPESELAPVDLEMPIFALVQEALNNVRKHADASEVTVELRRLSELFTVQISDNGRGFDAEEILDRPAGIHHLGLRTLRERVEQVGGIFSLQSNPGGGTLIRVRFPLHQGQIPLSGREREVLKLMSEGYTNRAIAKRLSLSIETIKSHVHHIMQKLQARDRTQAAVIAARQHWI